MDQEFIGHLKGPGGYLPVPSVPPSNELTLITQTKTLIFLQGVSFSPRTRPFAKPLGHLGGLKLVVNYRFTTLIVRRPHETGTIGQ